MTAVTRVLAVAAIGVVLTMPIASADRSPQPSLVSPGAAIRPPYPIPGAPTTPVRFAEPAARGSDGPGFTYPMPDVTADGLPDVLSLTNDGDAGRMTCLRGTDGRVVSSLTTPADAYVLPVAGTWNAALVFDTTAGLGEVDALGNATLTVRWVEACRQRWVRAFSARTEDPVGGAVDGTPFLRATVSSSTGRPAVLVETLTSVPVSPFSSRSVVHVVSGEDGSTLFKSDGVAFIDEYPKIVGLPDVSGDGVGDYAYAVDDFFSPPRPGHGDRLDAYASDDGRALWTFATSVVSLPTVLYAGDADDDGTKDFVLTESLGDGETALVSGATGTIRWRRGPGRAVVLGSDPLLVQLSAVAPAGGSLWLEVSAVDTKGAAQYAIRRRIGPSAGVTSRYAYTDVLGDVDSDGVLDVVQRNSVTYQDETTRSMNLAVSGRHGAARTTDVRGLLAYGFPAGSATIDARGDDVWSPVPLALRTGDRGTALAHWRGPGPVLNVFATRADFDRCPDLYVVTGSESQPRQLLIVSGASGEVVWSVPPTRPRTRVLDAIGTCAATGPVPPGGAPPEPRARIPATGDETAWAATTACAAAAIAVRVRRRSVEAGPTT